MVICLKTLTITKSPYRPLARSLAQRYLSSQAQEDPCLWFTHSSCMLCVGEALHCSTSEKLKISLSSPLFPSAFEITIDHPHTHVVKCTQLVRGENQLLTVNCPSYCSVMSTSSPPSSQISRLITSFPFVPASKDLAQTSYFMATNRYVVFQDHAQIALLV